MESDTALLNITMRMAHSFQIKIIISAVYTVIVNIMLPANLLKPIRIIMVYWNQKNKPTLKAPCLQAFLLLMLALPGIIQAQSVEQMQHIFPDKMAVFSNINRSVEIA